MNDMEIRWAWDDLSSDGSVRGESWSRPPFTVVYDFIPTTSMFVIMVWSNYKKACEWWNVKAINVHPKDKEAVGQSLLMLCEQRYAQENPDG